MMMDEVLDELFGVTPSISKGIHQSIDDLRLGGCCQYVADLPLYILVFLTMRQEDSLVQQWLHCVYFSRWFRCQFTASPLQPQRRAVETE